MTVLTVSCTKCYTLQQNLEKYSSSLLAPLLLDAVFCIFTNRIIGYYIPEKHASPIDYGDRSKSVMLYNYTVMHFVNQHSTLLYRIHCCIHICSRKQFFVCVQLFESIPQKGLN